MSDFGLIEKFIYFVILRACRSITPYIRKYGKHPVTGTPLKLEDLIPLTFHKNAEGLEIFVYFLFFIFWPYKLIVHCTVYIL